jgi:O-acetyl-ADP-ribose deacetylase (regulator of RNase III)
MNVELRQGDLTEQGDLDAIVSPSVTELERGLGFARLILQKGGPELEQQLKGRGAIELGEVVETSAGKLPARFVLHAAVTGVRPQDLAVAKLPGTLSSAEIIRGATTGSLALAERLKCKSIGLPPLGTGLPMLPSGECARTMADAVFEYFKGHPDSAIERVVVVALLPGDFEAFETALAQRPATGGKAS